MLALLSTANAQPLAGRHFLDNGTIRLGVDLGEGGAIVYLSQEGGPNMINNLDLGRQIQMSFYSGPAPYAPNGKQPAKVWEKLGWNPIQTGDYYGHASQTTEFESKGVYLHLVCIPMLWPLDNEPADCVLEESIWLDGNTVHVHNRLINHRPDLIQYPAHTQELPAIYSNGPWYRLLSYIGSKPFTGAPLTQLTREPPLDTYPGQTFNATEQWAALVDTTGSGFGIVEPGAQAIGGMFSGVPGAGGERDSATGYLSPRQTEVLDSNIDYSFDYTLVVGSVEQIRDYAYCHVPRPSPPSYLFKTDRQHWYYINAIDEGWPIQGELRVRMDQDDPQLIGPPGFWQASDAPKLKIEAAFNTLDDNAQVFWSRLDKPWFEESRSVRFKVIPDGKFHRYTVKLSASPEYKGVITGLRFDPVDKGNPGGEVRIRKIGFR